jgi:hypothetical protein
MDAIQKSCDAKIEVIQKPYDEVKMSLHDARAKMADFEV